MERLYTKALIQAMYYVYVRFIDSSEKAAYDAFSCFQLLRSQLAEYVGVNKAYLFARHVEHLACMKKFMYYRKDINQIHININYKQESMVD